MSVYKHKTIEISPQVKLDSEINSRFLLNEQGDLYFYCVIIVHILSSSVKTIQRKLSEGKKIRVKAWSGGSNSGIYLLYINKKYLDNCRAPSSWR
ncbi:MAG: hypothetical protein MI922_10115, partial [Bacteroidales bacterium]|nr:hypothetical protein [Bacteroidales bacterium]